MWVFFTCLSIGVLVARYIKRQPQADQIGTLDHQWNGCAPYHCVTLAISINSPIMQRTFLTRIVKKCMFHQGLSLLSFYFHLLLQCSSNIMCNILFLQQEVVGYITAESTAPPLIENSLILNRTVNT